MKIIPYAEAISYLMYVMTSAHLDLVFSVGQVVQFMANPRLAHWTIVKTHLLLHTSPQIYRNQI
jgi:hypothetical protein